MTPDTFASLIDGLPLGILVVNQDLRVQKWNYWMVQKTTIAAHQAEGLTLPELFENFNNPRLLSAIELCIYHKSAQTLSQTLNNHILPIRLDRPVQHLLLMQQLVNVFPIVTNDNKTLAVICIQDVTENIAKTSTLLELARKLEYQSTHDHLTGAYNRHFLWSWLDSQIKQCERHGQDLGYLIIDIDYFKQINDLYHHDTGDLVLQEFTQLLGSLLRSSDIMVRMGGEEFSVMLPHTNLPGALEVADHIIKKLRQTAIKPLKEGELRCSIGISVWSSESSLTAIELLKLADQRLYHAKKTGRDKVVWQ